MMGNKMSPNKRRDIYGSVGEIKVDPIKNVPEKDYTKKDDSDSLTDDTSPLDQFMSERKIDSRPTSSRFPSGILCCKPTHKSSYFSVEYSVKGNPFGRFDVK